VNPSRFAAVVSLKDRLVVRGSEEVLSAVLSKHSPASILPTDWPEPVPGYESFGAKMLQQASGRIVWTPETGWL
jgi:hypothetical protein